MDYEQEYIKVLERAKGAHNSAKSDKENGVTDKITEYTIQLTETIFPELKESEDEQIRKEIIKLVKFYYGSSLVCKHTISKDKMLAWLEKQGEKSQGKSALEAINEEKVDNANKVNPKFKIGDWITDGNSVLHITSMDSGFYQFEDSYDVKVIIDKKYHLWTINDAKDGDVLVCENEWTCIFKTLVNDKTFGSYCFIDCTGWFCKTVSKTFKEVFIKAYNGEIHPASKEQREQLEKAMFDAGYEWDAEKKELKRIEDELENYKKTERTSESTIYEDDIHYSNDCADCTRDSCEDCYPY